jgi:hypothetical protein
MPFRRHLIFLAQTCGLWLVFWVFGLPHYYRQYSDAALGAVSILLATLFALFGVWTLARTKVPRRRMVAFWLSVYSTVPFALLDTLYCGVYLRLGVGYLISHWYLSVFYIIPWFTFLPIARLLEAPASADPSR